MANVFRKQCLTQHNQGTLLIGNRLQRMPVYCYKIILEIFHWLFKYKIHWLLISLMGTQVSQEVIWAHICKWFLNVDSISLPMDWVILWTKYCGKGFGTEFESDLLGEWHYQFFRMTWNDQVMVVSGPGVHFSMAVLSSGYMRWELITIMAWYPHMLHSKGHSHGNPCE